MGIKNKNNIKLLTNKSNKTEVPLILKEEELDKRFSFEEFNTKTWISADRISVDRIKEYGKKLYDFMQKNPEAKSFKDYRQKEFNHTLIIPTTGKYEIVIRWWGIPDEDINDSGFEIRVRDIQNSEGQLAYWHAMKVSGEPISAGHPPVFNELQGKHIIEKFLGYLDKVT